MALEIWQSLKTYRSRNGWRRSMVKRRSLSLGINTPLQHIEGLRKYIARTPFDTDVVNGILTELHTRIAAELPAKSSAKRK